MRAGKWKPPLTYPGYAPGTREKQSLGDWAHLRREQRRLVEKSVQ